MEITIQLQQYAPDGQFCAQLQDPDDPLGMPAGESWSPTAHGAVTRLIDMIDIDKAFEAR